jgi:hypothetical protein
MRFIDLWKEGFAGANGVEFMWIRGHNHISPPLALMSGDEVGEEWGEDVVGWEGRRDHRSIFSREQANERSHSRRL